MPSPIKPNQLRESIASMDGDFCEKFVGSLNAPALFAAWFKSVFKKDGTLTDEFKAMVCLGTTGEEGVAVTPPTEPPVVTPPADTPVTPAVPPLAAVVLTATRGNTANIMLTWTASPDANYYDVYQDGRRIARITGDNRQLVDNIPPGQSKVYTVVAGNSTTGAVSPLSNSAYGYTAPIRIGLPPIP